MKKLFYFLLGGITGILGKGMLEHKLIDLMKLESEESKNTKKFRSYYYMLNRWIEIEQSGKRIADLFLERNYTTIAIYGMGEIGTRLYYALKDTGVTVNFVLDQQLTGKVHEFPVMATQKQFEEISALVVTIPFAYEEVKKDMSEKTSKPVVSLEHILFEV